MSDPQVDAAKYYNNGMSWEEFLEASSENVERMQSFFDECDFDEDTVSFFNGRTPLQVLAIAEDWCSDVVQNLAAIARISDEVPGMELSIVRREDHPELMDEYATDGKRRIPVIAFFDMTFRELARWSGRCKAADEWIFGEVAGGRAMTDLSVDQLKSFRTEYDQRYRSTYLGNTVDEWQHLLEDQDY